MKSSLSGLVLLIFSGVLPLSVEGATQISGTQILEKSRETIEAQRAKIDGTIRCGASTTPFSLFLEKNLVTLKLKGVPIPFKFSPATKITQRMLSPISDNIQLTPSDIIWTWLWESQSKLIGTSQVRSRRTWKLEIMPSNTMTRLDVWIDQKSFLPIKIEQFESNKPLQRTELISSQKINNKWVPRQIRIEKFDPSRQEVKPHRSYLEISGYSPVN